MACVCCALTCIHLTTVPLSAISEGMHLSVCSIYIRQLLGAQQKCMHYHAANISYIQISISHTSNISYVQISYIQEHAYVCSIYPTSWNVWIVVYCKHNNSKSLDTPIGGVGDRPPVFFVITLSLHTWVNKSARLANFRCYTITAWGSFRGGMWLYRCVKLAIVFHHNPPYIVCMLTLYCSRFCVVCYTYTTGWSMGVHIG